MTPADRQQVERQRLTNLLISLDLAMAGLEAAIDADDPMGRSAPFAECIGQVRQFAQAARFAAHAALQQLSLPAMPAIPAMPPEHPRQ